MADATESLETSHDTKPLWRKAVIYTWDWKFHTWVYDDKKTNVKLYERANIFCRK